MRTFEVAVMSTDTVCQIQGCDRHAVYTVIKDEQPVTPLREKLVCRRCAVEMVELFGWRLA